MPAFFTKPLSQLTRKWRIFHEESVFLNPQDEKTDFEELRGVSDTRIYRHGQTELAVSTDNPRLQPKLRRIPGLRPKTGSVFLFPDEMLDLVAETIKSRKRRTMTDEQRAAASARLNASRFGTHVKAVSAA
jgi:hypothetical protein